MITYFYLGYEFSYTYQHDGSIYLYGFDRYFYTYQSMVDFCNQHVDILIEG